MLVILMVPCVLHFLWDDFIFKRMMVFEVDGLIDSMRLRITSNSPIIYNSLSLEWPKSYVLDLIVSSILRLKNCCSHFSLPWSHQSNRRMATLTGATKQILMHRSWIASLLHANDSGGKGGWRKWHNQLGWKLWHLSDRIYRSWSLF